MIMPHQLPNWLAEAGSEDPGLHRLRDLLHDVDDTGLERMARDAQGITQRHFGRTISLYAPLYLSNYCSGGCAYCGYAADRDVPRHRLESDEVKRELAALRGMGVEEVLLLTGERTPQADYRYLRENVVLAADLFPSVGVEAFPMSTEEYAGLVEAGCTSVTLYQETYDPVRYAALHRWGPKADYSARLEAPERALAAGMRYVGVGALLGLSEPRAEVLRLYRHVQHLRHHYWRSGVSVSFPRICPQPGGYQPEFEVSERFLAQIVFAFRIALPDVPLVLSTRESPTFRDGMAGLGISKMSVASRTTVGGYGDNTPDEDGQFEVNDSRDVHAFCEMLRARGLDPVFKNWDAAFRG